MDSNNDNKFSFKFFFPELQILKIIKDKKLPIEIEKPKEVANEKKSQDKPRQYTDASLKEAASQYQKILEQFVYSLEHGITPPYDEVISKSKRLIDEIKHDATRDPILGNKIIEQVNKTIEHAKNLKQYENGLSQTNQSEEKNINITKEDSSYHLDLEEEFKNIVGLNSVKKYILALQARLHIEKQRQEIGLSTENIQTLHMIFTGNPGTGKTMMARIVADMLFNLGIIKSNNLIETDRSGLVAGYTGQTALKTKDVVNKALDGVLFIDEAYSLIQSDNDSFGHEAIDALVKAMDDYRDRLVVILAGYTNDMKNFISANPGLKSRFPNVIEFPDYSTDELMQIIMKMYAKSNYNVDESALSKLKNILNNATLKADFGNGRYARNVFERSLNNQALRLSKSGKKLSKNDLSLIINDDIEEI